MYLQITDKCNMTCEHCCFSATTKGSYMARDTFIQACKLASERGEYLTIGGGEPTLHALLFDFIGIAQAYNESESPLLIVTNGKKTDKALKLAKMARTGIISAALSQDYYHDAIDDRVVEAFTRQQSRSSVYGHSQAENHDYREIRSVSRIINVGRAQETGIGEFDECACPDLLVAPDGTLWGCGCKTHSFGTVFEPQIPIDFLYGECSRTQVFEGCDN